MLFQKLKNVVPIIEEHLRVDILKGIQMAEILLSDYHIQMMGYCSCQMPEELLIKMTPTQKAEECW